jgi:methyltransferase
MSTVEWVVALVALQRLAELGWSRRNEKALLARGGVEVGARHYPFMVLLHATWLLTIVAVAPRGVVSPLLLGTFVALQALRLWVITTLGPYWTTRIITVADAPLVRHGPYRWLRHPNYWIVVVEMVLLPSVFGAYAVAAVFSALNGILLRHRIRVEAGALARPHDQSSGRATNPPSGARA